MQLIVKLNMLSPQPNVSTTPELQQIRQRLTSALSLKVVPLGRRQHPNQFPCLPHFFIFLLEQETTNRRDKNRWDFAQNLL